MIDLLKIRKYRKMDDDMMARCMMPAMEKVCKQLDDLHEQTGIRYTYRNNQHTLTKGKKLWVIK